MNENTILRTVPAANDLHKVPGFDPMKHLRRTVNDKGEPVMWLELRYQRLWFRLACPKGRMLLNPLRLTDQLAIFEAKVFFHQDDDAPASSFTSNKTAQETSNYIRAAQDEALKVALDNAGFGIQLCDVTQDPGDAKCSPSAPPVQERGSAQVTPPAQAQTQTQEQKAPAGQNPEKHPPVSEPAPPVQVVKTAAAAKPAPEPVPMAQTAPAPKPVSTVQPAASAQTSDSSAVEHVPEPTATAQSASAADPAPAVQPDTAEPAPGAESLPMQEERQETLNAEQREEPASPDSQQSAPVTVLNFPVQTGEAAATQEDETPASTQEQAETPPQAAPSYTEDMTVEEICQVMTMEEASAIVVPRGPNKGLTMGQIAERRPSSLRFFVSKFSECSNSQKAAATLLIQEIDQKIAG